MKMIKLLTSVTLVLLLCTAHAQMYSTSGLNASGFNPQASNKIAYEKLQISSTLMNNTTFITISQLRFGILREPFAPATTVTVWVGGEDPGTGGTFSSQNVGSQSLNANGASTTTTYVTIGNGMSALYTTGTLNVVGFGDAEVYIGLQFSNTDNRNTWQYGGMPMSPNSTDLTYLYLYSSPSFAYPNKATLSGMSLQMFGGAGGALPVELTKFTASQTDKFQATLAWQTASERNNQGFQVEKSLDGTLFRNIGFAKGMGNSNLINDYEFKDNDLSKSAYYRLKQVDLDGKYTYSETVFVEKDNRGKVKILVYPNPSVGKFFVEHATTIKVITVFSLTGQVVFNQKTNDTERTEIDISNLASGLYFVRLNDDKGQTETKSIKVVSQ
jgi:hypothetical protein